jgi:hypothetical protein
MLCDLRGLCSCPKAKPFVCGNRGKCDSGLSKRHVTLVTSSGTSGPFFNLGHPRSIVLFRTGEAKMNNISIRDGLLAALTECYEADTAQFVSLPKQIVDSSSAREVIADLRNEGYVEEQERGVIRFTRRGYESLRERFDSPRDQPGVLMAV